MDERRRSDCWSEWLLHRRFGGDAEAQRRAMEHLRGIRDRVLDQAEVAEGDTLLDVGCGDGLIAFGALERGVRRAIFSDISEHLLEESRRLAGDVGARDRCRFVRAPADDVSPIQDESVDVVTTRSVLIYVADKRRAFDEFHRVLAARAVAYPSSSRSTASTGSSGRTTRPASGS